MVYKLKYVGEDPIPEEFTIYFYDEVATVINGIVFVEKEYNRDRLLKMSFIDITEEDKDKKSSKNKK